jgi:hypothetical protein
LEAAVVSLAALAMNNHQVDQEVQVAEDTAHVVVVNLLKVEQVELAAQVVAAAFNGVVVFTVNPELAGQVM